MAPHASKLCARRVRADPLVQTMLLLVLLDTGRWRRIKTKTSEKKKNEEKKSEKVETQECCCSSEAQQHIVNFFVVVAKAKVFNEVELGTDTVEKEGVGVAAGKRERW